MTTVYAYVRDGVFVAAMPKPGDSVVGEPFDSFEHAFRCLAPLTHKGP